MRKGCVRFVLVSVATFAALTAGWGAALKPEDGEAPWERAVLLGLLGLATVLSLLGLRRQSSELRLIRAASQGLPPIDGERAAAIVTLHPTTDAVLTAPFTGRPALVFSYGVSKMATVLPRHGKSRRTTVTIYEGDAMAPCEVRTPFGAVRMLEPPVLGAVSRTCKGPDAVARATAYLDTTSFVEAVSPGNLGEVKREVEARQRESLSSTGGFRTDCRISNPEARLESPFDLRNWDLEETLFSPDETVTLVGRYDAARGGFASVPTDALDGVFLSRGGAAEASRERLLGVRLLSGLAVVLLAVQAVVGGSPLLARARERAAARAVEEAIPVVRRLFSAAERGDADTVRRLLRKGADAALRDEDGQSLSHVAKDAATLEVLLDGGAPVDARNGWGATPLTVAADDGDLERVKLLLARGADPNARDESEAVPLLHTTDPAIRAALAAAGARDPYASPAPSPSPSPGP